MSVLRLNKTSRFKEQLKPIFLWIFFKVSPPVDSLITVKKQAAALPAAKRF